MEYIQNYVFYGKRFTISLIIFHYVTTGDPNIALFNISSIPEIVTFTVHITKIALSNALQSKIWDGLFYVYL